MMEGASLLVILGLSAASGVGFLALLNRLSGRGLGPGPKASSFPVLALFTGAGFVSLVMAGGLYSFVGIMAVFPREGAAHHLFIWLVNAPAEELSKFVCFAIPALVFSTVKEPQDGSLQGAACGLGFALGENFLYALSGGWELLLLRIFLSLPGHLIYGAVWGGVFSFEVFQGGGKVRRWTHVALALVPAVFFHALFNTLAALKVPWYVNLAGDGAALALGLVIFGGLRSRSPLGLRLPYARWKEAVPILEQGLQLNPRSAALRLRLGAYLLAGNRVSRSVQELEKAAEGDQRSSWPDFYLALAYGVDGKESLGRDALTRWRQKGGESLFASARRQLSALDRVWRLTGGPTLPGWLARTFGLG